MSAHDRHLANYRSFVCEAFCQNPDCPRGRDPHAVRYHVEYGIGWYEPEHCKCGGPWGELPVEDDDAYDDEEA